MSELRIYVGYDSREPIAYHVLSHSILIRASAPVSITPLALNQLHGIYTRQRGPTESTEFSLTRFVTPYLCDYRGLAVFMDCDFLCRTDIHELVTECGNLDKAVYVCKHDYTPRDSKKFLGNQQTKYPRKNWSSLMVFNLQHYGCRALTPGYVNEASGLELHRFQWVDDEAIGSLPLAWNHLVDEYPHDGYAKMVHFTNGIPAYDGYEDCDYAAEWREEYAKMVHPIGGI